MFKIAVMGDYDSIYGFSALGLTIFPVKEGETEQAARTLRTLADGEYGKLAASLGKEIDRYKERILPAIILIPGVSGNTGGGVRAVSKSVEQAVGSDILFG